MDCKGPGSSGPEVLVDAADAYWQFLIETLSVNPSYKLGARLAVHVVDFTSKIHFY